MKIKLLSFLAVFAALATRALALDVDAKAADFRKLANEIIAQTVSGKVDPAMVRHHTAAMADLAVEFANAYKAKFPAGAGLIDFMLAQKAALPSLTLEKIDAGFECEAINKTHAAEIKLDLTAEQNEHFGNVVDLFVHPATAAICVGAWEKNPQPELLKRTQSEIQEVIEHCSKVAAKLKG